MDVFMISSQSTANRSDATKSQTADTDRATVTLIFGCMFSGKTTALVKRIQRMEPASRVAIKHAADRRYADRAIVTHSGLTVPAHCVMMAHEILGLVTEETSVVAVDEAHFFDTSLVTTIDTLARRGIDTILTSLEPDSWGVPFPIVAELRALADESIFKTATCAQCRARADRTQRLTPIVDGNMVEGPGCYEPRCQACWKPPPEPRPGG